MKILVWIILFLLLPGCAEIPLSTPTPTSRPTTIPDCRLSICVRDVYLQIDRDLLVIQVEIADINNQVIYGSNQMLENGTFVVLALHEPSGEKINLGVFKFTGGIDDCYTGNDIPLSYDETIRSVCIIKVPMNSLAKRVKEGDPVWALVTPPLFGNPAIWLPSK